ncbi:YaaR family protein [Tuberibacillus sp. Marseille-P3662]|uniref:YaaR family protein n=1 Tax=Tuberibacillus sp. Marseille-P3662 TaxID=1965358 RepID=UPI000A1C8CC4|nr:YaaR family protein [Tuberibacillus sp. Marseille-P3662]
MDVKIQKDRRPLTENKSKPGSTSTVTMAQTFEDVMKTNIQARHTASLDGMIADIEQQGRRLSRSRTIRDLQIYKQLIHRFIQNIVDSGLTVESTRAWHHASGQMQTLIKQINEHLVLLTDQVFQHEASSIDMLDKMDEIKGMLINLYQ